MFPYYPNGYTPYNALRQPTVASINGRMVTGIEEAKAAQIELDGSQWYFPSPSEGRIYTKSINLNGLPVFNIYELCKVNNYEPKNEIGSQIFTLSQRLENLEKAFREMKHNESINANDAGNAEQSSTNAVQPLV